jgi:phosphopantetheine adenylyltransferase
MIIEYESDTNQDLILQSNSSGSLKYIQTGVGATTKTLILNRETILLQDPDNGITNTITSTGMTNTNDINLNAGGNIVLDNNTGTNNNLVLTKTDGYPVETTTLSTTSVSYTDSYDTFTTSWLDIINKANAGIPTLDEVLTAGNTATNSITLNNTGTGTNVINILPDASATNPQITLTNGTTTNTIDKNGMSNTAQLDFNAETNINLTARLNVGLTASEGSVFIASSTDEISISSDSLLNITSQNGDITLNTPNGDVKINGSVYPPTNATSVSITPFPVTLQDYYMTFVGGSGNQTPHYDNVNTFTYNPASQRLTAQQFQGSLIGNADNATNATNVRITSDNTNGTYFILFSKTSGTGNYKSLFQDDTTTPLTYNPSTSTLSATTFVGDLSGNALTATNATNVGLVKIGSVSVAITGSSSVQNLSFANLFNSSYKNYRIILEPTTQVSFTQYPSYALQAFSGTGTLPTIASLYGFEMTSSATTIVSPVYTSGATLSAGTLIFAVSSNTNKEVIFDIQNVGYANTQTQQVSLMCKSVYGNPGVSGVSDRTISCSSVSGATITGLTIQQSILSGGNNFTLRAVVYGYNQL